MPESKALKRYSKKLHELPGVVGTAVGKKMVNGKQTDQDAILVFVQRKLSNKGVVGKYSANCIVPNELGGIPTDVIEVGYITKQGGFKSRVRPIKPGYSCGHRHVTAGTIGGFFHDDAGNVVALSNNHVMACYDSETEVLTTDGWVKWSDINEGHKFATMGDGGTMSFQYASEIHKYFYDGDMYHLHNSSVDMMITPNHNVYWFNEDTKKYELKRIDSFPSYRHIAFTSKINYVPIADDEALRGVGNDVIAMMKLIGTFLASGLTAEVPIFDDDETTHINKKTVQLVSNDDNKLEQYAKIFKDAGFECTIDKSMNCSYVHDDKLFAILHKFGPKQNRRIPPIFRSLREELLTVIVDTFVDEIAGRNIPRTLADSIQEIMLRIGRHTTISYTNNKCSLNVHDSVTVASAKITQYSGYVYCATVPGHILMVRRNGCACWSGNSENKAKIGDPIYQPGPYDARMNLAFKGWPKPVAALPYFGTLAKFNKLQKSNNIHDSAICRVDKSLVDNGMVDLLYPTMNRAVVGWKKAEVGMDVHKCGRTTGYTTGKVIGLHASFSVAYDFGTARFENCIVMSNMSSGGDSGSLIMSYDMHAVGLLFAGSNKVTLANQIQPVKNFYKLKLITPIKSMKLRGIKWIPIAGTGSIDKTQNMLVIKSPDDESCFIEASIDKFSQISCTIAKTNCSNENYSAGISVVWADTSVKLGVVAKLDHFVAICWINGHKYPAYPIDSHMLYKIRIIKRNGVVACEIKNGRSWDTIASLPTTAINGDLICTRIGKTDRDGMPAQCAGVSDIVTCSITDIVVK